MKETSIPNIAIQQVEYGILVEPTHYSSKTFKIKLPKLMPILIAEQKIIYNRNVIINDTACKPTVGNSVKAQTYITVKRSTSCNLRDKANIAGIVPEGTTLTLTCMNGNIKDMIITDSV